tara:strand:+ start:3109 stop:3765 length:657 start_codon:yes stop_codon:yes gene_type:complete
MGFSLPQTMRAATIAANRALYKKEVEHLQKYGILGTPSNPLSIERWGQDAWHTRVGRARRRGIAAQNPGYEILLQRAIETEALMGKVSSKPLSFVQSVIQAVGESPVVAYSIGPRPNAMSYQSDVTAAVFAGPGSTFSIARNYLLGDDWKVNNSKTEGDFIVVSFANDYISSSMRAERSLESNLGTGTTIKRASRSETGHRSVYSGTMKSADVIRDLK